MACCSFGFGFFISRFLLPAGFLSGRLCFNGKLRGSGWLRGFRCRGLARKVLSHLMERALAAGMHEAFLEVRPSNTAAARLYHSMGFQQVGVRRGYYQATVGREDAAVLRRALSSQAK